MLSYNIKRLERKLISASGVLILIAWNKNNNKRTWRELGKVDVRARVNYVPLRVVSSTNGEPKHRYR